MDNINNNTIVGHRFDGCYDYGDNCEEIYGTTGFGRGAERDSGSGDSWSCGYGCGNISEDVRGFGEDH